MTIDPALSERLTAELRRRDASWREMALRLHDAFDLGPLPEALPVELGSLSPQELARFTVDVLWPPSQEERQARARQLMAQAYDEVCGDKSGVPDAHN